MDTQLLDFARTCIKSVWALELLVFLRQRAGQTWTAEQLVRELRSSPRIVGEALAIFLQAGLVKETDAGLTYAPASPELDRLTAALASAYAERPTAIVRAIVADPPDRLQAFADAFRLKKD